MHLKPMEMLKISGVGQGIKSLLYVTQNFFGTYQFLLGNGKISFLWLSCISFKCPSPLKNFNGFVNQAGLQLIMWLAEAGLTSDLPLFPQVLGL